MLLIGTFKYLKGSDANMYINVEVHKIPEGLIQFGDISENKDGQIKNEKYDSDEKQQTQEEQEIVLHFLHVLQQIANQPEIPNIKDVFEFKCSKQMENQPEIPELQILKDVLIFFYILKQMNNQPKMSLLKQMNNQPEMSLLKIPNKDDLLQIFKLTLDKENNKAKERLKLKDLRNLFFMFDCMFPKSENNNQKPCNNQLDIKQQTQDAQQQVLPKKDNNQQDIKQSQPKKDPKQQVQTQAKPPKVQQQQDIQTQAKQKVQTQAQPPKVQQQVQTQAQPPQDQQAKDTQQQSQTRQDPKEQTQNTVPKLQDIRNLIEWSISIAQYLKKESSTQKEQRHYITCIVNFNAFNYEQKGNLAKHVAECTKMSPGVEMDKLIEKCLETYIAKYEPNIEKNKPKTEKDDPFSSNYRKKYGNLAQSYGNLAQSYVLEYFGFI